MPKYESYRAVPFESNAIGFGMEVIHPHRSERSFILPTTARAILRAATKFRTIDEHVGEICEALNYPAEKRESVENTLVDLLQKGLLASRAEICSLDTQPPAEDPTAISAVAFVTANRPAACLRAAESYIENTKRFSRAAEFIVMDDSPPSEARDEFQASLAALGAKHGVLVRYAAAQEKERYAEALAARGIPRDVARFAVLGEGFAPARTTGSNRNCAILDTVEQCLLTADDDTVCKTATHPQRGSALRFFGHDMPRDWWFFPTREEALAAARWEDRDFLAEHELLLGASLVSLAAKRLSADALLLDDACDHQLTDLHNPTARVIITQAGVAGDSGGCSTKSFTMLKGDTLKRLTSSEQAFRTASGTRQVVALAGNPSVTHNPFCMTTTLGLDNRRLLPPFPPVYRNQDGVFGAAISSCFPNCYFGHVPCAVLHDAELDRAVEEFPDFRQSEMTIYLLSSCLYPPGLQPADALRLAGTHLQEVSKLRADDFWSFVMDVARWRMAAGLRLFETNLKALNGCPDYWRANVLDFHRTMSSRLAADGQLIPAELRKRFSPEEARTIARNFARSMGQLYSWWPAIIEAAIELKHEGIRISVPALTVGRPAQT